jgi:hypothetical protein
MPPGTASGFQSFVNNELPPGVAGDFAGANIRASVVAGAFAYVATPGGVIVGVGAWANPASKLASNYYQPGSFMGFVHRDGQAIITDFLGIDSMQIIDGDMVTVMAQGDFWGLFFSGATPGQKVYFDGVTGALTANEPGQSVSGAITSASLATTGILTVVTISGSPLLPGQAITGVGVPPGSYIVSQLTGTTGEAGTYQLANADNVPFPVVSAVAMAYAGVQESQFYVASVVTADADFTGSLAPPAAGTPFGVLTVSAVANGVIVPGQFISATGGGGLAGGLNTQILEQLTGTTGGDGTYLTTNTSATVTSTNTFVGTQGKLGRISSWLNS